MLVLVTGAGGQLGGDVVATLRDEEVPGALPGSWWHPSPCAHDGVEVVGASHRELPVDDRDAVLELVAALRPEVVIHAGAYTAVDACESDPDRALAVNALGTRHLAEATARFGGHLVYISTDYVFDGELGRPYHEWDAPRPLSVYGASKWGGERECPPGSTVVRTSWLWGTRGSNIVRTVLRLAAQGSPLRFVDDQRGSPTFTPDLAVAVAALALDRRPGVYHVTNQGVTTWFGLARATLELAGYGSDGVEPITTAELDPPRPAVRPRHSALDNAALRLARLPLLPHWRDALERGVAAITGRGASVEEGAPR